MPHRHAPLLIIFWLVASAALASHLPIQWAAWYAGGYGAIATAAYTLGYRAGDTVITV